MRPAVSTFESAWAQASRAQGWLTREQGLLLWHEARTLGPDSTVLEIGSYQGRSTIVLASAVAESGGRVVAVDPFVDDWKFGTLARGACSRRTSRRAGWPTWSTTSPSTRRRRGRAGRGAWTCSSSTASTTCGQCATTCAGPTTSRPVVPCWCTTASRQWGSPSVCSLTCCPAASFGTRDEPAPWRSSDAVRRARPTGLASCASSRGGSGTWRSRSRCGCGCGD